MGCNTSKSVFPFDLEGIDPNAICKKCHIAAMEIQDPLPNSVLYHQQFICLECDASWYGKKNVDPSALQESQI